jgi:hypothetical protein
MITREASRNACGCADSDCETCHPAAPMTTHSLKIFAGHIAAIARMEIGHRMTLGMSYVRFTVWRGDDGLYRVLIGESMTPDCVGNEYGAIYAYSQHVSDHYRKLANS